MAALAASVALAPLCRAESPHVYGFHSWTPGCDIDVMNGKTGWYVFYETIGHDVNLPRLIQAKGEGFTVIMGMFDNWENEIPLDRANWPAFAARCAELADQARDYCHIFHLDNEMEGDMPTPSDFTECFRMVRDEIKAIYPEAIVSNGGVYTTAWFDDMAHRLGDEIDGYQSHMRIPPDCMAALEKVPGGQRKPYYVTEFSNAITYTPGWLQGHYAEHDDWNQTHEQTSACSCWFVYDLPSWYQFSLKWLPEPKADFQWVTANTDYTNEYAERPVVISDVSINITSGSGGVVTWQTNIPSTTQIEWYGENATEGTVSGFDPRLKTDHWALITSCVPSYRYHLWVRSTAYDYGDDAEHFTFGTNTSTAPGGWLRAGWNLVSLPLEPADPRAAEVFDTAIAAGNDITNNLFAYDGTYSIYPSGFTTLRSGTAYWLRLDMAGDEYCEGLNVTSDVEIALSHGWNLIGQPHDYPTPLADCEVSDGATTLSFGDAVSAGWIEEPLYFYGASGYQTCIRSGGDDDQLRPWYGYWALTNTDGVTLIIP